MRSSGICVPNQCRVTHLLQAHDTDENALVFVPNEAHASCDIRYEIRMSHVWLMPAVRRNHASICESCLVNNRDDHIDVGIAEVANDRGWLHIVECLFHVLSPWPGKRNNLTSAAQLHAAADAGRRRPGSRGMQYARVVATVVVLNGTSSSGKTSLARAFQETVPRLFLNFSIDNILYALPQTALARILRGDDISDLKLSDLVGAFYGCVKQLLDLGHDLIIDHAVTVRYHAELLIAAVESHDALLVGLDCPPEVLARRERDRGDRRRGMAHQQQATIHRWLSYDLIIDTSVLSEGEAADQIVAALESGSRTGFVKTRFKLGV